MSLNETDFHYQVIKYIRKYHANSTIIPGHGEHQTTIKKNDLMHIRRAILRASQILLVIFMYYLKNEQECFIGYKTRSDSQVLY